MELLIDHVSKQFKDKTAVNDISLELTPGVWGLLGANTRLQYECRFIIIPSLFCLSIIRQRRRVRSQQFIG